MTTKNYYTLKDLSEMTGCTHRQLQYWEQKGYIAPKLGARNVRYYRNDDLQVVQQLLQAKKSGKTLGEAWGNNLVSITNNNPLLQTLNVATLNKINQLSSEWMAINHQLLEQLSLTSELEKNTPGYPYSLYHQDTITKLKDHVDRIKKTIKKRTTTEEALRKILRYLTQESEPELTPEEAGINTIDALILYWAKYKKGEYNRSEIVEIRESFIDRIHRGESYTEIVTAIKMLQTN